MIYPLEDAYFFYTPIEEIPYVLVPIFIAVTSL